MAILFEDDLPDLHSSAIKPVKGLNTVHMTLSSIDICAHASSSSSYMGSQAVPHSNICSGPIVYTFSVKTKDVESHMVGPPNSLVNRIHSSRKYPTEKLR